MKDNDFVSVVVPVYNVNSYLEECFESIRCQSYSNIEIILVDDGSTDGSGELCDELAGRDDRAVVLHKENGGLSDARNAGLRIAKGSWISFIDSDDYVSPIFIEVLLNAALETGCEIAAIPFGKPFKDGEGCVLADSYDSATSAEPLASHGVQRLMLYQALDTGAQWRLYARTPLGIDPFPVGLYYEDLASIYKIIHRVDKVVIIDRRDLYAYRMRGDSIIRQGYNHKKGESALKISDELYSTICKWYPDLSKAAASRCFSVCRMVFAQATSEADSSETAQADADELWRVIKRFSPVVFRDSSARKRERLAALIARMGKAWFIAFCRFARRMGLLQ